jgi:hypothetical protein
VRAVQRTDGYIPFTNLGAAPGDLLLDNELKELTELFRPA